MYLSDASRAGIDAPFRDKRRESKRRLDDLHSILSNNESGTYPNCWLRLEACVTRDNSGANSVRIPFLGFGFTGFSLYPAH
jgi:hypothetical protein